MNRKIKFLINRSEITAGTRGASLGPDAIMVAARMKKSDLFGRYPVESVPDKNHLLDHPTDHQFAKRIDGLIEVYRNVADQVSESLNNKEFPIVLAGDHGSAGGTIAGIKKQFPDKTLGVIWIDAHADLHTPYTTPSGNIHGMPLSTAINDNNLECRINDVPAATAEKWEELKAIGFRGQKVDPKHLIFIAVRDTEEQEKELMKRLDIKNYTVADVIQRGVEDVVHSIENRLAECDIWYVSFDVDSMDPKATSYGTGTPVRDGLMPKQARELLNALVSNTKTVCFELVEVNPCLDEKINRMGEVACELLESLTATLESK